MENKLDLAVVLDEILENNGINYNPIDNALNFIQTVIVSEAKSLMSALERHPSVNNVAFFSGDSNIDPIVTVITRKDDTNELTFVPAYKLDKNIEVIYNEDPVYKNNVRIDKFEHVASSIVSQILNVYVDNINYNQSYYRLPGVMTIIKPLNDPSKLVIAPHPLFNLYANHNNIEYYRDYIVNDNIGEILQDLDTDSNDDKIKISPLNTTNASLDYIRIDNKINDKKGADKMSIGTINKLDKTCKDVNPDLQGELKMGNTSLDIVELIKQRESELVNGKEQLLGKGIIMPNNPANSGSRKLLQSTQAEQILPYDSEAKSLMSVLERHPSVNKEDSYPIKPLNDSLRDSLINMTFDMMIDEMLFDLEEAASNLEIGLNDIKGNLNINKLMWFREVYCILENLQSGNDDELKSYNDMVLIYCMYNNMDTVLNIKPEYGDDMFDHVYENSLDILNDVMSMLSIEEELKFESI